MVSESELIGRLREFLRSSDLNTTTTATVRRQLEADFGIDLSDRKAFIREQVDLFLQSEHNHPQEQEQEEPQPADEDDEEEKDEETDKPERSRGSDSKGETEEEEDDDEDEEEQKSKNARNGKKNKGRSNKEGSEVVKKRGGGFCKLCSLSPQLQKFTGAPEMARTEVVKQLWAYIRENNLQDANNRRNIICDEPLRAIFGVDSINMFQMNKALTKHIWPLDSDDVIPVKTAPKEKEKEKEKEKQKKHEREGESEEPKKKEKRQKGGKSGFLAPLQLSDALVNFLGTGESELSRAEVIKRMWDYIKGNNLQDPSDKRKIICDKKLKELFDLDTFTGFTVTKLLAPHFIKAEQ
ncbi:upstream activation factor subunit spp27-like [Arachis stenosperma]|uniref:upstream activation factor subunit spp27-like n=1 Tax=Arachis stenosperma TaxID=217475 RepID=UPI0025AD99E3|nr:upstream activation factor subunit spp27-like [Arachis stenosperma]